MTNSTVLEEFMQHLLWPEVILVGLVLGWCLSGARGVVLAGAIFAISGPLLVLSAWYRLPVLPGSIADELGLMDAFYVRLLRSAALKAVSAMIWALFAKLLKAGVKSDRSGRNTDNNEPQ